MTRAFSGLLSVLSALLVTVGCGPPRPALPPPKAPLTRTPDAVFRQHPPAPDTTTKIPAFRVPEVGRHTLDNGLAVYWVERNDYPLVATAFIARSAGHQRVPQQPGLAALTARMLLRGTRMHDGSVRRSLNVNRRAPAVRGRRRRRPR